MNSIINFFNSTFFQTACLTLVGGVAWITYFNKLHQPIKSRQEATVIMLSDICRLTKKVENRHLLCDIYSIITYSANHSSIMKISINDIFNYLPPSSFLLNGYKDKWNLFKDKDLFEESATEAIDHFYKLLDSQIIFRNNHDSWGIHTIKKARSKSKNTYDSLLNAKIDCDKLLKSLCAAKKVKISSYHNKISYSLFFDDLVYIFLKSILYLCINTDTEQFNSDILDKLIWKNCVSVEDMLKLYSDKCLLEKNITKKFKSHYKNVKVKLKAKIHINKFFHIISKFQNSNFKSYDTALDNLKILFEKIIELLDEPSTYTTIIKRI